MFKYSFFLFLHVFIFTYTHGQIKVMSFNIRYDNPDDGPNNWKFRKDNLSSLILYHNADIIGMQEVLKSQLQDLERLLPNYKWVGVGRDDGKEAGEFSPVFYNTSKFEAFKDGTFWLSEHCDIPGKMGWDAVCNRVVTWIQLKEKSSGKIFFVFNTHFDHVGKVARKESAALINKKIKEIAGQELFVLTGDFNCTPGSEPYNLLVNGDLDLVDTYGISATGHYGQEGTTNGFRFPEQDNGHRIDIIFVKEGIKVLNHATFTDSWGGKFPSDHFPVLTTLILD